MWSENWNSSYSPGQQASFRKMTFRLARKDGASRTVANIRVCTRRPQNIINNQPMQRLVFCPGTAPVRLDPRQLQAIAGHLGAEACLQEA